MLGASEAALHFVEPVVRHDRSHLPRGSDLLDAFGTLGVGPPATADSVVQIVPDWIEPTERLLRSLSPGPLRAVRTTSSCTSEKPSTPGLYC